MNNTITNTMEPPKNNPFNDFLKLTEQYISVMRDTELEPYDKLEQSDGLLRKIEELKKNHPEIQKQCSTALIKLLTDAE